MQNTTKFISSITEGFGKLDLNGSPRFTSVRNTDSCSNLLSLPNELLLEIASHIAPTVSIAKDEGFGHGYKQELTTLDRDATSVREKYASELQVLLNLSLTCKALVPIAQDILYRNVSLLGPHRGSLSDKPALAPSSLSYFLRTLLQRPDLAEYVHSLSVWMWKGRPLSPPYDIDMEALYSLVNSLKITAQEKQAWFCDFDHPLEASFCGLVFAALPQLRSVQLYAAPSPESEVVEYWDCEQTRCQVARLSEGLSVMTQITELTLSTGLNGLRAARLPSLKTLTVDFDGFHQFVMVGRGNLHNVETLKLQYTYTLDWSKEPLCKKLGILLRGLRGLRTIEFPPSVSLPRGCEISDYVETIKFRGAKLDQVYCILDFLDERFRDFRLPQELNLIEVHCSDYTGYEGDINWPDVHGFAVELDIKIAVISKDGTLCRVLG